ncbi:uncharacterized protein LOC141855902 [Brevipalpus obovatus]|uniref:uncharacterized protein LOC141855902 n=1 Tax=Brevipalpus obovatus TaxID=246614 RepID=UPI003D9E97F7
MGICLLRSNLFEEFSKPEKIYQFSKMKCFFLLVALVLVISLAQSGDANAVTDMFKSGSKSVMGSIRGNKGNTKNQQQQKPSILSRMTSKIPGLGNSRSKTPGGNSGRMSIPGFNRGNSPSLQAPIQGGPGGRQ